MGTSERLIEASGGVLWRPRPDGTPEVCLVHRPKYDDYSVPKGKLARGEHVLLAACREVWEETGFSVTVGRPLGEVRYLKDGLPKRVRYWAMRIEGGSFSPNEEVDRLEWLPPAEAVKLMNPERDPVVVERFAADPVDTVAVVVLRHGSADPTQWRGSDADRPLDETGRAQADALVSLLGAYGVTRVMSAEPRRCLDTVTPFAEKAAVPVELDPLLSEAGHDRSSAAARAHVVDIAHAGRSVVLCSQGPVIPDLVTAIFGSFGATAPKPPSLRKGTAWVLHVTTDGSRLVAAELLVA